MGMKMAQNAGGISAKELFELQNEKEILSQNRISKWYCECGAENELSFKFCPKCGRKKNSRLYCTNCGFDLSKLGDTVAFCPGCGNALNNKR